MIALTLLDIASGKTLEEVREIFEDPRGIPYIGTPAWQTKNSYKAGRALEKGEANTREGKMSEEGTSPDRHSVGIDKA